MRLCHHLKPRNYILTSQQRNAPYKLQKKFVLKILYEPWLSTYSDSKREHLERFFRETLDITDCGLNDYVNELRSLQECDSEESDTITLWYEALYTYWKSNEVLNQTFRPYLGSLFENHALIYVASNEGSSWRKPSECVWSTAARLRDKLSLNIEYENLRGLFVDVLGVKQITLQMAIDELKEAGSRESACVGEVKASLQTVNSLLSSEPNQEHAGFGESKIFPVRYPEGAVRSVSAQTEFFIVDRESLRLQFEDEVKFLDFSLEEVNELRPFIEWAGLESRYVTRCVRESTSVGASDARPISKPHREIRPRAHALLRYLYDIYVQGRT